MLRMSCAQAWHVVALLGKHWHAMPPRAGVTVPPQHRLGACHITCALCQSLAQRNNSCRRPHDVSEDGQLRAGDEAHAGQLVLSVFMRLCTSEEPGMPAPAQRLQSMHKAQALSLAAIMDICAIFAHSNLASCGAIAQACWRHCSLGGVPQKPAGSAQSKHQLVMRLAVHCQSARAVRHSAHQCFRSHAACKGASPCQSSLPSSARMICVLQMSWLFAVQMKPGR